MRAVVKLAEDVWVDILEVVYGFLAHLNKLFALIVIRVLDCDIQDILSQIGMLGNDGVEVLLLHDSD